MILRKHNLVAQVALGALVAPLALAQDGAHTKQHPKTGMQADHHAFDPDTYVPMSGILGHEVRLEASDEAKREAREDGDAPAEGPTASIQDLIVDTADGRATWAVLSVGGFIGIGDKVVAVPYKSLRYVPPVKEGKETGSIYFQCTEEQLKKLPAFDAEEAQEQGMANAIRVCESTWTSVIGEKPERYEAKNASSSKIEEPIVVAGKTVVATRPIGLAMATNLDDLAVHATDKEFGSIDRCIMNPESGTMEFAVVSTGGVLGMGDTLYLLPAGALDYSLDAEGEARWTVNKTAEQMKQCQKFDEETWNAMTDEHVERCHAFFGLERKDHDAMKHREKSSSDKG